MFAVETLIISVFPPIMIENKEVIFPATNGPMKLCVSSFSMRHINELPIYVSLVCIVLGPVGPATAGFRSLTSLIRNSGNLAGPGGSPWNWS